MEVDGGDESQSEVLRVAKMPWHVNPNTKLRYIEQRRYFDTRAAV
jgi:hypothetical protein